ncbi:MAG: alpha/beta fold hydrolase [Methanosarcina sp.]
MQKVTSKDGTIIAYDRTGKGSGVILIDGALSYREHSGGRPLAAELSKEFTVITYDRRGRGESTDTKPYAMDREIEDIEALIDEEGGSAYVYGFSSGSVLALRAAAKLREKIAKLVLHESPLDVDDNDAKQSFAEYKKHITELLKEGKNSDAVSFFFADMLPAEAIEDMKQSPDWQLMEAVAPTLVYENEVMGDGSIPIEVAKKVTVPTLVLDGDKSPDFKHEASDTLAEFILHAQRKTLSGQSTLVSPEVLAPVLKEFFKE